MEIEQIKIVEALSTVIEIKTGQDIMTLNMMRDLKIEGDRVNFTLVLPSMNYEGKSNLNFACIQAINSVYPAAKVHVHLSSSTGTARQVNSNIPQVKNIIAVASGKGGVGKSTVSVNLALGLQKLGARVGIMDADLYGPSIPTMMGLKGQRPNVQEIDGKHKIVPLKGYGMPVISIGFIIEEEQAVVLRGPRLGAIIKQFFNDCLWPPLDYLIIDLPPGTGDIQLTLVQTVPVTGVVLVTTPQDVAMADAVKAMNMFLLPSVKVPILGVVENMAWFTPEELPDNKYYIFGEGGGKKLAKMSNSVLLSQVPLVQAVREGGDQGKPAILDEVSLVHENFMEASKNLLRQIALRNEMIAPTQILNVKQ